MYRGGLKEMIGLMTSSSPAVQLLVLGILKALAKYGSPLPPNPRPKANGFADVARDLVQRTCANRSNREGSWKRSASSPTTVRLP